MQILAEARPGSFPRRDASKLIVRRDSFPLKFSSLPSSFSALLRLSARYLIRSFSFTFSELSTDNRLPRLDVASHSTDSRRPIFRADLCTSGNVFITARARITICRY